MTNLSLWQRIRRRIALLGGSYQHPDGYIELDFEAAAGVDRRDSEEVQEAKLERHWSREARFVRIASAVGLVVLAYMLLTRHEGKWDAAGSVVLIAFCIRNLAR